MGTAMKTTDKHAMKPDATLVSQDPVAQAIGEYLAQNPDLADALRTFQVAQDEYDKSISAFTTARVITAHSTNAA
jgi:hypothetical protein